MTTYYRTIISEVGPEVADLIDGGILILFAAGSPPELAEVSVLHTVAEGPTREAPPIGARVTIGAVSASLTAVGSLAWNKIADMGHVVINFDGGTESPRTGELSCSRVSAEALAAAVRPGTAIEISG